MVMYCCRDVDDEEIIENIDGRMHGSISGFIDRFFGNFQYAYQEPVLKILKAGKFCGRYNITEAPLPNGFPT